MTTKQIITLAKEKLGKDITELEAQEYLSGKIALPDEALEIVSGGGECSQKCPRCGGSLYYKEKFDQLECYSCGYTGAAIRKFD